MQVSLYLSLFLFAVGLPRSVKPLELDIGVFLNKQQPTRNAAEAADFELCRSGLGDA